MREAIERGSPKINGGSGKVVYPCGICQGNIKKSHGSVICTKCSMWIHLDCTKFTSHEEATKHKDVFKCENCEKGDEAPKVDEVLDAKVAEEEAVDVVEKNVVEFTNTVLLSGADAQSFSGDITNADVRSLENGCWVTDNVLSLILKNIQKYVNGRKTLIVDPCVSQMLRKSLDSYAVTKTIEDLKLLEMDFMFFPVNNNDRVDREGGSHWSLLVCSSDGKKVKFSHHDPLGGTNNRCAHELISKLSKASALFRSRSEMVEVDAPKQTNGYDCGIYTVIYAGTYASNLVNMEDPKLIDITPMDVSKCRRLLQQKVREMKDAIENRKKKKLNKGLEQKASENRKLSRELGKEKIDNDNREQPYLVSTRNVCGKYINQKCRRGSNCPLEHPAICEADIYKTHCKEEECELYHPQVCFTNWCHKVCDWGADCKFRHLREDVQDHEHRGNHFPTNQNLHRYRNGRDQNKRESHNRNIRKNYNISSENTYNGKYGGRDGHLDNRRGSQRNRPNGNENQNSNYRRDPQRDRPGDNFNHFLGYRQSPMDWPVPTERGWLEPIRELIRSELENWSPARW